MAQKPCSLLVGTAKPWAENAKTTGFGDFYRAISQIEIYFFATISFMQSQLDTGCCPRFHPDKWDEKGVVWDKKPFIKSHVRSFFHIPVGFGKVVVRSMGLIKSAGAENPQNMMLSEEGSAWGSDLYIAVSKEVPNAENVKLSGKFITKVFEGPYKNAGKWAGEMVEYVKSKNREPKKLYFWYTTCPKCAKAYGKNYVVIFAQVE